MKWLPTATAPISHQASQPGPGKTLDGTNGRVAAGMRSLALAVLLPLAACPLVRLPEAGPASGGGSSSSSGAPATTTSADGASGAGTTSGGTSGSTSGSGGATSGATGSSGSASSGQSSSSGAGGSTTSGSATSGTSGAPGTCPEVWTANGSSAPHALAADGAGHLFAVEEDATTYRVVELPLDDPTAPPVAIDGGFAQPTAIGAGGPGTLWIADAHGAAAEVDVASGLVEHSIPAPDSLCAGGAAIAWDPVTATAYLAGVHQLWVLADGGWQCFWPGQCGSATTCPGESQWQFGGATGLVSDLDGGLLVSDYSWSCVERVDLTGGTLTALGPACQSSGAGVYGANGIAMDEEGRIFVSEYPASVSPEYPPALASFDGSGWVVVADADAGCAMDLQEPEGLAPAPGGGVFVADTIGGIYRYTP